MSTIKHVLGISNFFQNWSNTSQITTNDNWSGVASIVGYLGRDITTSTGTNPQILTGDSTVAGSDVDVIANQLTPNTLGDGGVAEFEIADPVVALNGSGTADAPHLVVYLDATGRENIVFSFRARDLDGSGDNSVQQVAVQYRVGGSGPWINLPAGYIADATSGPSSLGPDKFVTVTLPAGANNASDLQVRVMTTNAAGNDEWVGIDDISVTSTPSDVVVPDKPGAFSITDAVVVEGNSGTTPITFTVSRGGDSNVAAAVNYTVNLPGGAAGASASDFASPTLSGTLTFAQGEFSKTITLNVAGDLVNEADEAFTVTLSSPTNGATLADGSGAGTITNDDLPAGPGVPFVNEIHYDNVSTDSGEAIEIAGPAGTNLAGWSLVLYSVSTSTGATQGATYATIALSGVITNQDDGYGTLSFAVSGLQNGPLDGFALVSPGGQVVQFLSYEGAFVASNGPAAGMTSTDIGVSEDPPVATGLSLQLVGSGASAADFTWVAARDDNFGAVNTGQDFIGPNATGLVSVRDASVAEGDSGVKMLVFTVTRAGGLGQSAAVDWSLNLNGSANSADIGAGQPLSGNVQFGIGVSSVTVSIAIQGDTVGEGNETLNLLLANPTGNIVIADASATGTILNDDPIALKIYEIQGEGHATAFAGQPVLTSGIVTGVVGNGFYLQDPTGDGNTRTSDGIFVFTGSAPAVAVGDAVQVVGKPAEFVPGDGSLSITELVPTSITVQSHGNALPAAVLIGIGGVLPPTSIMEDDGFTSFDPATDGLDFYESMEGMRVTIDSPVAVSQTNSNGETWVLASGGAGSTGYDGRGGITISAGDFNPERIQIDATTALFAGYAPDHTQGDRLSSVTGIMNYAFNNYEVLVTEAVTVVQDFTMPRETTSLVGDRDHLTIASYNVENLDPGDGPVKFNLLAQNIVYNLQAPDIIALQEVQDANGLNGSPPLSGVETANLLIAAIDAAGGPHYVYVEVAPSSDGSTGGEPGGNIRNGFLYNADRVSYIVGSAFLIDAPAFNGSRKPLVADFVFNDQTIRLIDVHFTSRLGSDPLQGANQPPNDAGDSARTAQGQAVAAYVNSALASDPSLKLGVMGDFNGFYFEGAVGAIEATGLTDLHRLNAVEERYSYIFDGNLQAIDHMLVDGGLLSGAMFDAVHINAEQPSGAGRATDHDPIVGRFVIEHANEAPFDLVLAGGSVDENAPAGTLVGTASADDPDPEDVLGYSLVDDAGGRFAIDPSTGAVTTTGPLDHEAQASYDLVIRATDPDGLSVDRTVTINVGDVNETPAALVLDDSSVDENAPAGTLVGTVSASDPDGDALSYTLLDDAAGRFALDATTGALTTTAPLNHEAQASYDLVIRATDPDGLSVERTVTIGVGNVNEAPTAAADAVSVNEDATTGNLWNLLLGNDSDPDAGATLSIASVNGTGTLGSLVFDAAGQSLRYVADHDAFDALAPGETAVDTFTYTVTDSGGLTSTATVSVTVTGIADGVALSGGNGNDSLAGTAGEDQLNGGNGNDVLSGLGGHDLLLGGNGSDSLYGGSGNDVLAGGNGNDLLSGGAGADTFRFGRGGGADTILDFDTNSDQLLLENGIGIAGAKVSDVNGDGIADLTIAFSNGGGSVVLLGVGDFASVDVSAQAVAAGQFNF
ncbi:MAG TPA: cadherin domain-containing protein [Allosphingosinicella sp.]|jgi:VCBS repeat-containing protein|nr:cadherin domain-containing protein [Allosphingosinicella sp.]